MRQMLDLAQGEGAAATRIAAKTGLTTAQAREYFEYMMNSGLIQYDPVHGSRRFRTTPKGIRFMKVASHISELMVKERMDTL